MLKNKRQAFALGMTILWSVVYSTVMGSWSMGISLGILFGVAFGLFDSEGEADQDEGQGGPA